MEETNRRLTHFYRRTPEPDGWIQTTYVTRKKHSDTYYFGRSEQEVPKEKISEDIEIGSLVTVEKIIDIIPGQTVWIAADRSAHLASAKNPIDGIKIYDENLISNYDYIENAIDAKVRLGELNTSDPVIEPLFSEFYWKNLVDILITKIKIGEIDQDKFRLVGYVFARLGAMYNTEFKKLLNRHDVAYSEGELRFMDRHFVFQRWEIYIDVDDPLTFFNEYSDFDTVRQ